MNRDEVNYDGELMRRRCRWVVSLYIMSVDIYSWYYLTRSRARRRESSADGGGPSWSVLLCIAAHYLWELLGPFSASFRWTGDLLVKSAPSWSYMLGNTSLCSSKPACLRAIWEQHGLARDLWWGRSHCNTSWRGNKRAQYKKVVKGVSLLHCDRWVSQLRK